MTDEEEFKKEINISYRYCKIFVEEILVPKIDESFFIPSIGHFDPPLTKNDFIRKEESTMTKLTTKKRNKLPKSSFGLPSEEKYPMPDKSHAANAKARATQMVNKGKLSESQAEKIKAKANKILKNKKGKK